ncbi:MAG: hypothetical protein J0H24_18135, partial [Delftia acidovorans]|nr:hypothetical protein [Delftia acidovorans]
MLDDIAQHAEVLEPLCSQRPIGFRNLDFFGVFFANAGELLLTEQNPGRNIQGAGYSHEPSLRKAHAARLEPTNRGAG